VGWWRQIGYDVKEAYASPPKPPQAPLKNTDPKRLGGGRGGAASQEEDHGFVVEARRQGTASSPRSLFAVDCRSRTTLSGYGSCNNPGAQGTGRFVGVYRIILHGWGLQLEEFLTRQGLVTNYGTGGFAEYLCSWRAGGIDGAYPITEIRRRHPPNTSRL